MIRTQATPEQIAAFHAMRTNTARKKAERTALFVKPCLIEREDGFELQLPLKTEASNAGGPTRGRSYFAVRKLRTRQFDTTLAACQSQLRRMERERVTVIDLTRIGPRPLDAHDNLPQSFKHVVDAVCAFLVRGDDFDDADRKRIGVFDDQLIGKGHVTCRYAQLTHELDRRLYGIRIRFRLRPR